MEKTLLIWGAGKNGQYVVENIVHLIKSKYSEIVFYDNNSNLWGENVLGYRIVSKSQLLLFKKDELNVIIATELWESVLEDCKKIGIEQCLLTIVSSCFNPFFNIEKQVLCKYGFIKSKKTNMIIDNDENAIPWYTYPAIEFLKKFDYSEKEIFEYGSGFSSVFWSEKCKKLISIESNNKWYEEVKKYNLINQELIYEENEIEYAKNIYRRDKYDVIIIDGIRRDLCAKEAIKK